MNPINLTDLEFKKISALVYNSFGIKLNDSKRSLVVNRLSKLLRKRGFDSFTQYYKLLMDDKTGKELQELANNISTNHTFFNREAEHFNYYSQIALPEVTSQITDRDLRVWCCASSSGEEPYTLAMLQREFLGSHYKDWRAGLLATDISESILQKAITGEYPAADVQKLPAKLKNSYFTKSKDDFFTVKPEIKKDVAFKKLNLINPFKFKKKFHIIFCRNVMIYFDQPTKDKLVQSLFDNTVPGGYLFIGHSETIPKATCPYEYIKPAVYRKV